MVKGEALVLEGENEDDFSKDVTITADDKGVFTDAIPLSKIKDEMHNFSLQVTQLTSEFKESLPELLTDHITTLRQTKLDPTTGKLLTKYQLINMLAGSEVPVGTVRAKLESFYDTFGGSF